MQINSVDSYCKAYSTNSVSMNGRISDKTMVVNRVRKFFEGNKLSLNGDIHIRLDGNRYPHVEIVHFGNPFYYNPSPVNKESLFGLALNGELKKVTVDNSSSVDEILYNFAKKFGGKTIYDYISDQNQAGLSLLAGTTKSTYNPEIKVPDFSN